VVAPRRAAPLENISVATKTPDRPRHPLHDAAGRPLLNPRLYTDRIRGFPTLPPPQRPAEGGETGGSPSASWIEQGGEKTPLLYCSGEEIRSKVLWCIYVNKKVVLSFSTKMDITASRVVRFCQTMCNSSG
jgi:hypothetical protein